MHRGIGCEDSMTIKEGHGSLSRSIGNLHIASFSDWLSALSLYFTLLALPQNQNNSTPPALLHTFLLIRHSCTSGFKLKLFNSMYTSRIHCKFNHQSLLNKCQTVIVQFKTCHQAEVVNWQLIFFFFFFKTIKYILYEYVLLVLS